MSRYRESILTDKGLDLARKAANGIIKITFTKGVLSSDAHQNDNIQAVEGLTTLNAFVQSDPINYVTPSDDANVNVPLRFHNTNMTTDGYINTVGLYATDGTTEVLYSIIINDDPELFAAYNGTTPESVKINHTTQVGRADQVNVQVSPMGMVTEEELQSEAATRSQADASIISSVNSNVASINSINSDKAQREYSSDHDNDISSINARMDRSNAAFWSDAANHEYKADHVKDVNSVADSLGDKIRVGFDSVGDITTSLYFQMQSFSSQVSNKANTADMNNAVSSAEAYSLQQAQYNIVGYLKDTDDILNLPQNGHYVIVGQNPANNPWGNKAIWADVYKTDYNYVIRDNTGNEYIRSNYDSVWRKTLNSFDQSNIQTQINAIDSSVINQGTINGNTDLNNVFTPGTYWCNFATPVNAPSQLVNTWPRFKLVVISPTPSICNQVIYLLDGANVQGLPNLYTRNTYSGNTWNAWQHSSY